VGHPGPPAAHQPTGPPAPGRAGTGPLVTFARDGLSVPFSTERGSVLGLADACDVPARWRCRTGVCHICVSPLLSGDVSYAPDPLELGTPAARRQFRGGRAQLAAGGSRNRPYARPTLQQAPRTRGDQVHKRGGDRINGGGQRALQQRRTARGRRRRRPGHGHRFPPSLTADGPGELLPPPMAPGHLHTAIQTEALTAPCP
jgi:hypothetical protein